MKSRRASHRKYWWQFGEKRPALVNKIAGLSKVLATARVSKYVLFEFLPTDFVFLNTLHIFPMDDFAHFCLLQSNIHSIWALRRSSSVGVTPQYTPLDCFYNFPFPDGMDTGNLPKMLLVAGQKYHKARKPLISSSLIALTKIYNHFHDPNEAAADFARLRELHVEMDNAVAAAYSWGDLDLGHDFHETQQGIRFTISEPARREVLARLLELNHQRYEEEVSQGLHEKKSKKGKKKTRKQKVSDDQIKLL